MQVGQLANSVYNISAASIFRIDDITRYFYVLALPETYIRNINNNLSTAYNVVSTLYKADTQRTNVADATIAVYPCPSLLATYENAGRYCLTAGTFELTAGLIHSGTFAQFATCYQPYQSYVSHFNAASATQSNVAGTYFKADPTKNYVSDASITVAPNALASSFTRDPTNYGTMSLNANSIYLGSATSSVYVPGTLYVPYTNASTGAISYISVGQYLHQTTRTRLG